MTRALRPVAASILRTHFDTEASDAGLRSLDLASTGGQGLRSYDAAAVARADRTLARAKFGDDNTHQRINETLRSLSPSHAEILSLAYGVRLRSRDTEDGKKRRAVRSDERNWRVRLAELYGQEGAAVLASPLAKRLAGQDRDAVADGSIVGWLLNAGKTHFADIAADTRARLDEALDAFVAIHGITEALPTPRQRSSEKTRSRVLAFHAEHGQEIGG